MPSESTEQTFYRPVEDHLQQGDIFQAGLVAPLTSFVPRLFRAEDGRHGSVVFTGEATGKVFSPEDLKATIGRLKEPTPLHTAPFAHTPDGHPEMVVTSAEFAEFFILASQTCDLSGEGSEQDGLAAILRATPLRTLFTTVQLPLDGDDKPWLCIHDCLLRELRSEELQKADHATYSQIARTLINEWKPDTAPKKAMRGKIKNAYRQLLVGGQELFFLGAAASYGLGEMTVDLATIYTCPVALLRDKAHLRKATLVESYRNQFAQNFGLRFSRIATPKPMVPEKFD